MPSIQPRVADIKYHVCDSFYIYETIYLIIYNLLIISTLRKLKYEPTLKSKACLKCLYFTKIISALCCYLEYFSYLYTIN